MDEFDYDAIRADRADDPIFSWEHQSAQYPARGEPGISYFQAHLPDGKAVDCLLYRDERGELVGILNRFPQDIEPYERAGNASVYVHPQRRRRGIGSALIMEALDRWGLKGDFESFTDSGAAFAAGLVRRLSGSSYDFRTTSPSRRPASATEDAPSGEPRP